MSLLARSVATLEGIALTADPNYQMVAQVRGWLGSGLGLLGVTSGGLQTCDGWVKVLVEGVVGAGE